MANNSLSQYSFTYPGTSSQGNTSRKKKLSSKSKKNVSRRKKIIKRSILATVSLVVLAAIVLGVKIYADEAKVTGDKNPLALLGIFEPSSLNESYGRVNILLAGYSVDDPGHQGAELTDSIMMISYDPTTKSADLISIPRDTWVDIPGFGYEKINAAYEDGEQENFSESGYAQGGMGLLEEVVQQNFGIHSDYYGLLDYSAFKDAVNAVGGVSVDIQSSDPNGLYDPNANLNLPNGEVTLNGQQALNLARARGDGAGSYGFPDGDFDRTQHQQQLLVALKNKATSASVISNPLKIASLADSIGNNLKTDLSIGDMETLYEDSKSVNNNNIKQITLDNYNGKDLFQSYTASDGEDAEIPAAGFNDFVQIKDDLDTLLGIPETSNTVSSVGSETGSSDNGSETGSSDNGSSTGSSTNGSADNGSSTGSGSYSN